MDSEKAGLYGDGGAPPLDPSFYDLDAEESAFYKLQTGIQDDKVLKEHILAVQRKAYELYSYPCIRRFSFTKLKISRMPVYEHVIRLGRERPNAVLLDIGCCFGNDIRKAIVDGYPVKNAIGSDILGGFWDLGHELFKSTPDSFPVPFIEADVFEHAHLAPHPPFYGSPNTPFPDLKSLKNLTPLHGHVSAIHASALFHLFQEDKQFQLAAALASLLSPLPGSVIFGAHAGAHVKELRASVLQTDNPGLFCHSIESWGELWDGQIFKQGTVKVEANLREIVRDCMKGAPDYKYDLMTWSVTRI